MRRKILTKSNWTITTYDIKLLAEQIKKKIDKIHMRFIEKSKRNKSISLPIIYINYL